MKERYFKTETKFFLDKNDILLELVQGLPYLNKNDIDDVDNRSINNTFDSTKINTSIGWFYKCNSDRLIYIRYLDGNVYDVIDIQFKDFKNWVFNNMGKYKLQYTKPKKNLGIDNASSGTINLGLPLGEVPKPYIFYTKNDNNEGE